MGWVRELLPGVAREAGQEQLARDAEELGGRLFEFSEFLVRRLGVEDVGASYPRRVTLHPTCHSQRVTCVGDAPQRLLAHVRGLELLELPEAAECCGFGGTFSVKNADVSLAMLADKCASILATGAEVVTAVDPSCLLHIGGGLSRLAPAAPGGGARRCAPCTWRTSWRLTSRARPAAAPSSAGARRRSHEPRAPARLPRRGARGARRRAAARQPARAPRRPSARAAPPPSPSCPTSRSSASRRGALKDDALSRLDELLDEFEAAAEAAGAQVHRAADAAAANDIVAGIARDHGVTELVKMKSLATDEIGLDAALAAAGVEAVETDLAELIVQLAGDTASHILVPAVHYSRGQVRDLFAAHHRPRAGHLSDDPHELAEVSRLYLRERFLRAGMGVTGANVGVAETGTVCVVENEGNGRMCTTLPPVLVTVMGIEKVVPTLEDLGLLLRLLPRSATGERMSSYASLLTGVTPGDGPQEYHIVLLDNGRRNALADPVGRQALRCIRCSACLNVCPVYTRVGGHAYGSIYPGADRRDPDAAAVGDGGARQAAVRVVAVRRLRRGLPGRHRHPRGAAVPAGAGRARAGARAREGGRSPPRRGPSARRGASPPRRSRAGPPSCRSSAAAWSAACRRRSRAGRRVATCAPSRARRSASGGRASAAPAAGEPRERRRGGGAVSDAVGLFVERLGLQHVEVRRVAADGRRGRRR